MFCQRSLIRSTAAVLVMAATAFVQYLSAAEPSADLWAKRDAAVARSIEFLAKNQQADGSWSPQTGAAVTALVTAGLLKSGRTVDDPLVAQGLKYLEKYVQPDGGIYTPDGNYKNYETSLALAAFAEVNKDGRYKERIAGGEKFVRALQWDETEGKDKSDPTYGGAGYGKSARPDLSNTSFFIDALKSCGAGPDDEAIKKALIFVSRCQNLETEHNTTEFSVKNPDGGFYYTPAAGGSSQAGKTETGGLRSYASMTYAGLKSMIYAGVGPDDPRVKAAVAWLKMHYSLSENPGMGTSGLFYYYHTFAKALDAMGQETFVDASGASHDWRAELAEEFVKRQNADGSWTNSDARWMEGDPNLVSGYALLTLAYLKPVK
jgi:squalene-hopene/tetraprenyl-beta-curcumene cyclase